MRWFSGKSCCSQAWWLAFNTWDTHGGRGAGGATIGAGDGSSREASLVSSLSDLVTLQSFNLQAPLRWVSCLLSNFPHTAWPSAMIIGVLKLGGELFSYSTSLTSHGTVDSKSRRQAVGGKNHRSAVPVSCRLARQIWLMTSLWVMKCFWNSSDLCLQETAYYFLHFSFTFLTQLIPFYVAIPIISPQDKYMLTQNSFPTSWHQLTNITPFDQYLESSSCLAPMFSVRVWLIN